VGGYKDQDWHKLWTDAKKADKVPQSLFHKRLGKAVDKQRALFKKLMATTERKTFDRLFKQHGEAALEIKKTIEAYRVKLKNRAGAADTLRVLTTMQSAIYNDMLDDKVDRRRELGFHK
jgi:hypothetical protein